MQNDILQLQKKFNGIEHISCCKETNECQIIITDEMAKDAKAHMELVSFIVSKFKQCEEFFDITQGKVHITFIY